MEVKPIEIIKKGDVVKCPPNVKHWHGASADVGLPQLSGALCGSEHGERYCGLERGSYR